MRDVIVSAVETDLVSLKEAARICCVGQVTIKEWVRVSGARVVRAAGEKWVTRSHLATWLQSQGLAVPIEFVRWPRVLVVEDEDDLRLLIVHYMRQWWGGAEIRGADDGEKALKILDEYHPDLAIVDFNLPGTDGLTLCREASHSPELAHMKILVMTGSRDPEVNARAFDNGAAEFIQKPFDPEILHMAAQRLLGSSRSGE